MKNTLASCAIVVMLVSGQMLQAQLPVSKTAGVEPTKLNDFQFQFVSLQFTNKPVARGTVTSVSTDTVTLDVPAGTFTGLPAGSYAAVIVSGPDAGTAFDASSLTGEQLDMDGLSSSGITLADDLTQVEVVKKMTLDEAYPEGSQFKAGSDPSTADFLLLVTGGSIEQVYYNNSTLPGEWRKVADDSPAGSLVIEINSGVIAFGTSGSGTAVAKGIAPSGDQVVPFNFGQFNSIGSPYGTDITLGDLNSVVKAGSDPSTADQIIYATGSGLVQVYRNSITSTWKNVSDDIDVAGGDSTSMGKGFFILGLDFLNPTRFVSFQQ